MTLLNCNELLDSLIVSAGVVSSQLRDVSPKITKMFSEDDYKSRDWAAEMLQMYVGKFCDPLMHDLDHLLQEFNIPSRYNDLLYCRITFDATLAGEQASNEQLFAKFIEGIACFDYEIGRLVGVIQAAKLVGDEVHTKILLDSIVRAVEDVLLEYDELQNIIGTIPPRHTNYIEHIRKGQRPDTA